LGSRGAAQAADRGGIQAVLVARDGTTGFAGGLA
jgi:hypothetical protein